MQTEEIEVISEITEIEIIAIGNSTVTWTGCGKSMAEVVGES